MTTLQIITAALLGVYVLVAVYALLAPTRGPDPQRGVGQGCMLFVILGLLAMGGLLALAVVQQIAWLGYALFAVAAFPGIGLIGGGITHLIRLRREQRFIDES